MIRQPSQSACELAGRQLEQFRQFSELSLLQVSSNLNLRAIAQCTHTQGGSPVSVMRSELRAALRWWLTTSCFNYCANAARAGDSKLSASHWTHIPSRLWRKYIEMQAADARAVMGRARFVTGYANDKIAGST